MLVEPKVALDCPYCKESIYETLSWFKKDYSTCPFCEQGLVSGQFSSIIASIEKAFAANIEEMITGKAPGNCCGKKSSCCD